MKLRNKKTGEVIDLDVANIKAQFGGISVIPEPVKLGGDEYVYYSLEGLMSEWEDYKPKKPLIKDEKIRKAVKAWAEINSIEKVRVNVSSNGARGIEPSWFSIIGLDENGCSWEIEIHADYFETVSKCYKGDMVGIAELCGEEEAPEPLEPTLIDLDERIKEKEE